MELFEYVTMVHRSTSDCSHTQDFLDAAHAKKGPMVRQAKTTSTKVLAMGH